MEALLEHPLPDIRIATLGYDAVLLTLRVARVDTPARFPYAARTLAERAIAAGYDGELDFNGEKFKIGVQVIALGDG